jgi:hypothetical protein
MALCAFLITLSTSTGKLEILLRAFGVCFCKKNIYTPSLINLTIGATLPRRPKPYTMNCSNMHKSPSNCESANSITHARVARRSLQYLGSMPSWYGKNDECTTLDIRTSVPSDLNHHLHLALQGCTLAIVTLSYQNKTTFL